jgi:hypothetical protein
LPVQTPYSQYLKTELFPQARIDFVFSYSFPVWDFSVSCACVKGTPCTLSWFLWTHYLLHLEFGRRYLNSIPMGRSSQGQRIIIIIIIIPLLMADDFFDAQ